MDCLQDDVKYIIKPAFPDYWGCGLLVFCVSQIGIEGMWRICEMRAEAFARGQVCRDMDKNICIEIPRRKSAAGYPRTFLMIIP